MIFVAVHIVYGMLMEEKMYKGNQCYFKRRNLNIVALLFIYIGVILGVFIPYNIQTNFKSKYYIIPYLKFV